MVIPRKEKMVGATKETSKLAILLKEDIPRRTLTPNEQKNISYFERASALNPTGVDAISAHYTMGHTYFNAGHLEKAEEELKQFFSLSGDLPSTPKYAKFAEDRFKKLKQSAKVRLFIAMKKGDTDKVEEIYLESKKRLPNHHLPFSLMTVEYYTMINQPQKAIEIYDSLEKEGLIK
jgi:tetratricopeptide (TPR) repeat protein